MPFDGNGNWTSTFSAIADRDANIKILASRFDGIFIADLVNAFNNCLTRDGQGKPSTNFNANNYKVVNVADPQNPKDAVNKQTLDTAISGVVAVETGTIIAWGATNAPSGYLKCDGSTVSRTTYAKLFSVIGTRYGSGDGSTTFNLPNLIGRSPWMLSTTNYGSNGVGSLPNITGRLGNARTTNRYQNQEGALYYTIEGDWGINDGGDDSDSLTFAGRIIGFDAARSSNIYQYVSKVTPSYLECLWLIKY